MMYAIACIEGRKTIGYWDSDSLRIRTKTICIYKDKADAIREFDIASCNIVHNYEGIIPAIVLVSVGGSAQSMYESLDRHLETVKQHWPLMLNRISQVEKGISKIKNNE